MEGTLSLNIIEGLLIRNTEIFMRMDPYLEIDYMDRKIKTKGGASWWEASNLERDP